MRPPPYYPVFLDLTGKECLVVGAGPLGLEKTLGLLRVEARVRVVAKEVSPGVENLHLQGKIDLHVREFEPNDLEGRFLVIAATEDRVVNREIADLASRQGKLSNAVDDPDHCNFILAAVVQQGPVQVVVSSSGCSPALAKVIRDRVADEILSPGTGELATYLGDRRERVKHCIDGYENRKLFWEKVLDSDVREALRDADPVRADDAFDAVLAKSCTQGCGGLPFP